MANGKMEVPAYARTSATDRLSLSAVAGVSAGLTPPRISYRAGRFHVVDRDGMESAPMMENDTGQMEVERNQVEMDVVIVGALPFISKIYYDQPYQQEVDSAPACFSDNGTGPSERARLPQAPTCAVCPHNVWGVVTNPTTGKQRQACANIKKLAVVRYHDNNDVVYSLTIPGASLKPFADRIRAVTDHGLKVGAILWRIGFDTKVSYPKLEFRALEWLKEDELRVFESLGDSDEVRLALGSNDKAMAPDQVIARKTQALAPPTAAPQSKPLPSQFTPPAAPAAESEPKPLGGPVHTSPPPAESGPGAAFAEPPMELPAERPKRGRPRKGASQPLPDLTPHPSWEAQHPPQGEAAPPPPPSAQAAQDLPPAIYKTLPQVPNIVGGNDFEPASSELDDAVARAMKVKT